MRPNHIVRRNWLITTNTLLIVTLAGALFFLLGRLWQRSYRRPVVQATPGHTVIHNRPRSQRGGRSKKHLNFQGAQRDPLGVYPRPVKDLSPARPRYHAYGYPPPRVVPTFAEIDKPVRVGYLIPVGGENDGQHLNDYSHLPLYKNRLDQRGYRFSYFTMDNGAQIYLRSQSKKDDTKTCHPDSGTDGCPELFHGDSAQLAINDAEYRVHIYGR